MNRGSTPTLDGMLLRPGVVLLVIAAALLAGCGKSSSSTSSTVTTAAHGKAPSLTAKMICEPEAEEDIGKAIGVEPTKPVRPTSAQALYSCPYEYANGTMTLSVKELADTGADRGVLQGTRRQAR